MFDKDLGMASAIGSFVKALAKRFVATDRDLRALRETLSHGQVPPAASTTPLPVMVASEHELTPPPVSGAVDMKSPFALVDVAVRLQALAGGGDVGAVLIEAIALGTEELARRKREIP